MYKNQLNEIIHNLVLAGEKLFTYFMVHSLHSLLYFHCTSKGKKGQRLCTLFMVERLGHRERGGDIHKSNPQANYLIIKLEFQRL